MGNLHLKMVWTNQRWDSTLENMVIFHDLQSGIWTNNRLMDLSMGHTPKVTIQMGQMMIDSIFTPS